MKNWNYINGAEVGNRKASEIQKDIDEVEANIDSFYRAGENPPKSLEDRLKRLKDELSKAETGNSTEKLFEGLAKDAEKEEEKSDEALDELKKTGNTSSFVESAKRHMGENHTKSDAEYWQYVIDKINKNDPEEKAFIDTAKKELEKTKANLAKTGNSASDDKFAYVMREFDEGKLKTPDGKVVTDPAQAKAIAYSESKKTENGLARARNAMACNKEITLWNGNDTALVKADGTVLYLESNSFETGRDKFDSQELAVKELAKNGYKSK